ncbi:MAG: hypothetical protein K8T90_08130 [Planctomycetes bacterium]|nr:hypothetical protein [Planctomycetota bacterium]
MPRPRAVELSDLPGLEPNLSGVELVAMLDRLFLVYHAWPRPDRTDEPTGVAVVEFQRCLYFSGGGPNDEALHNHPAAPYGIQSYRAWEITNSPEIRKLGDLVHKDGSKRLRSFMRGVRHFVFAFKEDAFDCFAFGYHLHGLYGSRKEALQRISEALERPDPWPEPPVDPWACLEERVPKVPCPVPECDAGAVRFSVFCREHHIENGAEAVRRGRETTSGD